MVYTDNEGKPIEGVHSSAIPVRRASRRSQLEELINEKTRIAAEVGQLREDFATLDAAYAELVLRHEQGLERLLASEEEAERLTVLSQSAAQLESERVRLAQQKALLVEEIDALRHTERRSPSGHRATLVSHWWQDQPSLWW